MHFVISCVEFYNARLLDTAIRYVPVSVHNKLWYTNYALSSMEKSLKMVTGYKSHEQQKERPRFFLLDFY
jgi:adenosylmethionine-8-amino-7-oxononanoate aminotransferase